MLIRVSYIPMRHQNRADNKRNSSAAGPDTLSAWLPVVWMLVLAIIYVIITGLFTYPLFSGMGDSTPAGSLSGDQCQTIWFFWWTKTAIFSLHTSPFWTDAIYFPYGTSLGPHLCLFTNLLAIAVAGILGVSVNAPLVYNALLVLSFALAGLATFSLIRRATQDAGASFIASLFVAFAPARLWHLDHLNLLSFGWGLLAIHYAMEFLKKPKAVALAMAVVFSVIAFYSDLTNAMLTALFLIAYALVRAKSIWNTPERSRIIVGALIGIAVAVVLILPGLLSIQSGGMDWRVGWQDTETYSADLLSLVVPWAHASGTGPGEAYIGWLLLILAGGTLFFARTPALRPWTIMAAVFLVLSLGPALQIGGYRFLSGLMPGRWLFEIVPYMNLSRSPVRFLILAQLCLAVIAAHGLSAWLNQMRDRAGQIWRRSVPVVAGAAVVILLFWEYDGGNTGLTAMTVPSVYGEVAGDPSIRAICDIPISDKLQIGNWYMYWQTFHGRKAANGYLSRPSKSARTLVDRIKGWQTLGPEETQELINAGIDAVVYHDPTEESRLIRLREIDTSGQPAHGN